MHKPILGPGLCECGCGQTTRFAAKDRPRRFASGHRSNIGPVAFWHRIEQISQDQHACWEWIGPYIHKGYAMFGKRFVHREMYEATHGPLPVGMFVLHRCDNRKCCNPAHLFLGTHADNMRDMAHKGRSHGSGHKRLTKQQVQAMAERSADGATQDQIAHEFGLSEGTTVSKALKRARARGWLDERLDLRGR